MKYRLLKLLFLGVLFIGQSALAIEPMSAKRADPQAEAKAQSAFDMASIYAKQRNYEKALEYLKISYEYEEADGTAYGLGFTYKNLQDYDNAIKWYKKSVEMGNADGGVNLGFLYDEVFKDYPNAIKWYKKAYEMGNSNACVNLGILYEEQKDIPKAIEWYKKGIEKGNTGAYDNISLIYHDIKKDNLTASAYYIATIDKSYSKKEILDFLHNDWKIDEATIKKAYELQKTLVPDPYTGGIEW